MKIGRYQLRGINKRFWFILGFLGLVIFGVFYFWPKPEDPLAAWTAGEQTAFSEIGFAPVQPLRDETLSVEDIFADERLGNCSENRPQCIYSIQDPGDLIESWYPDNVGIPFRFRAYLPSQDAIAEGSEDPLPVERSSLYAEDFSDGGWSFRPAVLSDALSLNDASAGGLGFDAGLLDIEAANAFSLVDDGFIAPGTMLLGFQEGVPASGAIYDFDAILFSTSNAIKKPGDQFYRAEPVPTLLVRDFRPVGNEEVFEPASQVSDLDITYSAGERYQLSLHNFEWPSDGKARMCVTLANRSSGTVPIWSGLYDGIRLRVGGITLLGAPAVGSRFEIGTETSEMQTGETLSGYIVFGLEQEGVSNVANVSGTPEEQEVRLSIGSLLQADPGTAGSLVSQEVFVDISDGSGGGLPFTEVRSSQADWVAPLGSNETCAE